MGAVELDSDDVMAEMLYLRTQKILKQVVHPPPPPLSKGLFIAIHSECGGPLPFAMRQALCLLVALARCSAGWGSVDVCYYYPSGELSTSPSLDNTTHLFTNAMPVHTVKVLSVHFRGYCTPLLHRQIDPIKRDCLSAAA